LAKEADVTLGPHLMVLVFVLIYSVSCLILLKDFIEARSFNIVALSDCVFAVIEQILWLLFFFEEFFILIQLHD
jgi:hypothetical protein